jgi:23S rRNA (uracil1939-C5)-methyltransferase
VDDARVVELAIDELSDRGAGRASDGAQALEIAGALPGERVRAALQGERGEILAILDPSPDRIAPICRHFGDCGGCVAQHMAPGLYAAWKRGLVAAALARAGVAAPVGELVDAHGEGRRRATFHARFAEQGPGVELGFMRARAHAIVGIESCPVLAPGMANALDAARVIAGCLRGAGKPLDIAVVATLGGLDIDFRGSGALDAAAQRKLVRAAGDRDLARLSNHGELLIERRPAEILMGAARVRPPPGGFLQATEAGERVLAALALDAVAGARRVADLFCGAGALSLRLAARAQVDAFELDRPALGALMRAARETVGLRAVAGAARDLFQRPLGRAELDPFDAVVFDPPRAGAQAQARELAASRVQRIVAISCNPASFARDMSLLVAGGYRLDSVTPIDQFRFSPHVEIVGVLTRPASGIARKRGSAKGILG